jgi:hypothetical protein
VILGALVLPLVAQGDAGDPTRDPAWPVLKQLVGGAWEGTVGKNVKVRFKFSLQQNGRLFRADGLIDAGSLHPLVATASVGWDPDAKQLYYLDQHGYDTVYFGHVYKQGDDLIWDFNGLSGDKGHYQTREIMSRNSYINMMRKEVDGKWVDLGFHISMKRAR